MDRVADTATAPSSRFLQITAAVGALPCAAILGLWFWFTDDNLLDLSGAVLGRDFVNYWTASYLIWQGDVPTIFDPQRFFWMQALLFGGQSPHFWSYPPSALLIVAPLALIPYLPAFILWNLSSGLAFWAGAQRFFADRRSLLLLLAAPSTFANILFGQNGFLTAALLLGGLALLERRPAIAGLLFGLLAFKPQLGLLLPVALIAGRHWRALAVAAVAALMETGLSVLVFGPEPWRTFWTVTVPFQADYLARDTGLFLLLMPTLFDTGRLLGLGAEGAYALQAAGALVMAAIVAWAFALPRDRALQAAVLLVATMLATPLAFVYDLATVSAAVLVLDAHVEGRAKRRGDAAAIALAWLLPLLQPFPAYYGVSIGPFVLAALLWCLVRRLAATSAPPARSCSRPDPRRRR